MSGETDFYDILGLSKTATSKEIRMAYMKLAKKYHPDKNDSDGAQEYFAKISNAYEILSDPSKRKIYDSMGTEGLDRLKQQQQYQSHQQQRKYQQVVKIIYLRDLMKNDYVDVEYERGVPCDECNLTGFADKQDHKCSDCDGEGERVYEVQTMRGRFHTVTKCPHCSGTGRDTKGHDLCSNCRGECSVDRSNEIRVRSQEIFTNKKIIVENSGSWVDGEYCDLCVIFDIYLPDNYFHSVTGKLIYMIEIKVIELVYGFCREIKLPGRDDTFTLGMDEKYSINPNSVYIVPSKGPGGSDLLIMFKIDSRETLSSNDKMSPSATLADLAVNDNIPTEFDYYMNQLDTIYIDPADSKFVAKIEKHQSRHQQREQRGYVHAQQCAQQ